MKKEVAIVSGGIAVVVLALACFKRSAVQKKLRQVKERFYPKPKGLPAQENNEASEEV